MSGTEHFTGEYYYNGKPIYAKTVYVDELPNKSTCIYEHGISEVDEIWADVSKCMSISSSTTGPFPYVSRDSNAAIMLCDIKKSTFTIISVNDRSSWKACVTLNYTKTSDSATNTTALPTIKPKTTTAL